MNPGKAALGLLAIASAVAIAGYAGWALRGNASGENPADAPLAMERPDASPQPPVRQPPQRWWHRDDVVESLGLTLAQRERLDALFAAYHAASEPGERRVELGGQIVAAMERGAWDEARTLLATMTEGYARAESHRLEVTIAIFDVLDAEQRRLVGELYPRLYRASWLRPAPRRRGAGASGPRPR